MRCSYDDSIYLDSPDHRNEHWVLRGEESGQGECVMPGGRPSIYTQDLADLICERLAMGESMRSVSNDEDMPSCQTMFSLVARKA